MIERCWSGGQTGADFGALRAARECGIEPGGWAPKGWLREGGPAPWLADWGLLECPDEGFPARTEANVRDCDVTVWFGDGDSAGFWCTRKAAERLGKPFWIVGQPSCIQTPAEFCEFWRRDGFKALNASGSRASKAPDLEDRVFRFLCRVFKILREDRDGVERRGTGDHRSAPAISGT